MDRSVSIIDSNNFENGMTKQSVDRELLRARRHKRNGEFEQALSVYRSILAEFPRNTRARKALAELEAQRNVSSAAGKPPADQTEALIALLEAGKFSSVIEKAKTLAEHYSSASHVWNIMGAAHKALGELPEAEHAFRRAAELNPNYAHAYNNIGIILKERAVYDEAIVAFQRALEIKRDYAEAHNNLGNTLKAQGKLEDALAAFQRALEIKEDYVEAHNNVGVTLTEQGEFDQAVTAFRRAIEIKSSDAQVQKNMGVTLKAQGELDAALTAFRRALQIKKDDPEIWNNIGVTLKEQGKLDEAILAYQRALEIKHDYTNAEFNLFNLMQETCDWRAFNQMQAACEHLGITTTSVDPFPMLTMEDNAFRQKLRSEKYAEKFQQNEIPLKSKTRAKVDRIRVGYFSADFHNHPMLHLMLGMLRTHDRSRFEIYAYSYGEKKFGELRRKAKEIVDHFFDVSDMTDQALLELARSHEIDIAIDLMGYTKNSRSSIFQYRIAPIQINYLGYPGTMGARFIDYIFADSVVIPNEQRANYTENVLYLPHSYLATDNERLVAKNKTNRSDFGLPEHSFVFCCFNQSIKIKPTEFDIWMRILGKLENSVLWLMGSNRHTEQNLQKEAETRGIDSDRLVFAKRVTSSEHLARHKHADLFLDTFAYNAHTTATDALWTGLPVVTKLGEQFSARVAASLLKAVGMPELITTTEKEYEELILEIAFDKKKLNNIKTSLNKKRLTLPLFDTLRNTRNFESGLLQIYDIYCSGGAPRDIWIKDEKVNF